MSRVRKRKPVKPEDKPRRRKQSDLELSFATWCHVLKIPKPISEFRFHPERFWRFDFAWVEYRVAVEIEGGIYCRGRHVRPQGFIADCEKYNQAALLGWRVFRFPSDQVKTGDAAAFVKRALMSFQPAKKAS